MNGQRFYFAQHLPWGGLCTMYGRKFSLVLFKRRECSRGPVVWVCLYFTQSKAFYALNLGPAWGQPQTPWALLQTKITQGNFVSEFGVLLISMNVPPRKVCLLVQSGRDLMPQIGVMVCFHVDSHVKAVHLKNITPIHVGVLFFKTHTLLFFWNFWWYLAGRVKRPVTKHRPTTKHPYSPRRCWL